MDAAITPRRRTGLVLVVAVFALAALSGCGDDDDTDGTSSEQSAAEAYRQAGCAIAAKTVELIASRLRAGHGAREIIEEYGGGLDKGCEFVIEAWINRPGDGLGVTITGTGGDPLDEQVSGGGLTELAPKTPGTNQRSCLNWETELLRTLCQQEALREIQRLIEEQQQGQ